MIIEDLTAQQKVYEATLEETHADLINANCPIDNGMGRKISDYFKKNSYWMIPSTHVSKGFPPFLFEVNLDKYADCIDKKNLDIDEEDFLRYLVWKTFKNKLFIAVLDVEKGKFKQEPREVPYICSQSQTVKELVDMATAKNNLYKATGKTKQVQLSLAEQSELLQLDATNKISTVAENLCSKFKLGVITTQELTTNLTTSASEILIEGFNKIHDTLKTQFQESLNQINLTLPMSENKQLTATKEEK